MDIKRIVAYFRVQIKIYLRNKSALFVVLLFPVMMTFIFGSIMSSKYLQIVIPGLIGFAILADSLFSLTTMVAKYRLIHLFSELSLTPLKRSEWLIAVFLWHLIIATISFTLIAGLGYFAYSASINLSIWISVYLFFGTLLFVSMGLLIGNVAKTTETASVIGNAVGFPMMMLTGTFFPVTLLPSYLQEFVRILPLYYFVQGLGDIMVTGKTIEGLLYLLVLLVMSIVFFWMAIYTFKWRDSSSVSKIARPIKSIQRQ